MCVIQDECVLLVMLVLEMFAGLPVMALMKMCGVAYAVLSMLGVLLSVSLAFVPRLRWCCGNFAAFVNEYGIAFFLLVHATLLSLSSFTIFQFARPFLQSSDFAAYCVTQKLDDNLSHTGCERLQGAPAVVGWVGVALGSNCLSWTR